MNEKPIVIERAGGSTLVGMLHPALGKQEVGVLVMVAGGPQYRIGGHRQLVLWARKISAQGFPVFRFDFSGMGDSYGEYLDFENTEDDIGVALNRFFETSRSLGRVQCLLSIVALCPQGSTCQWHRHAQPVGANRAGAGKSGSETLLLEQAYPTFILDKGV